MSVFRLQSRRLAVSALPWVLVALSTLFLAWTFLHALDGFLAAQSKLAAQPTAPGFTDLIAVPLVGQVAFLGMLLAPLLAMSMLAGEQRAGTLPLLHAAGVSPLRIVLGKFLAGYLWLALVLAITVAMPLALAPATDLDGGKLAAATFGVALLLASLFAIGIACSAWTSHPALAAAVAILLSLGLWWIGAGATADQPVRSYLALSQHLQPMLRGLVASRDVAFFLILTALALALAVLRLGDEKVRG